MVFDPQKCQNEAKSLSTVAGKTTAKNGQSISSSKQFTDAKDRMLKRYETELNKELQAEMKRRLRYQSDQKFILQSIVDQENTNGKAKTIDLRRIFRNYMANQLKNSDGSSIKLQKSLTAAQTRFVRDCISDAKNYNALLRHGMSEMKKKVPVLQDQLQNVYKENYTPNKNINALWNRMEAELKRNAGDERWKIKGYLVTQDKTKQLSSLLTGSAKRTEQEYYDTFIELYKKYIRLLTK